MIGDNLADDEDLQRNIGRYRLDEWVDVLKETVELLRAQDQRIPPNVTQQVIPFDDEDVEEEEAEEEAGSASSAGEGVAPSETTNGDGVEGFDGDDEESADPDQDVEMEG
jgi:hypothetical protein